MMVYVLLFSLLPLIVDLWGAGRSPWLFNLGIGIGVAAGTLAYLRWFHPTVINDRQFWGLLRSRVLPRRVSGSSTSGDAPQQRRYSTALFVGAVGPLTWALFAWSTHFVDTSITTIAYAMWPILFILVLPRVMTDPGPIRRFRTLTADSWLVIPFAFLGLGLLVIGTDGISPTGGTPRVLWGVVLAVVAAVGTALNAFTFRWGSDFHRETTGLDRRPGELVCVVIAFGLSSLIAAPVNLVGAFTFGQGFAVQPLLVGAVTGCFVVLGGAVSHRKANLATDDLSINRGLYTVVDGLSAVWCTVLRCPAALPSPVGAGGLPRGCLVVAHRVGMIVPPDPGECPGADVLGGVDVFVHSQSTPPTREDALWCGLFMSAGRAGAARPLSVDLTIWEPSFAGFVLQYARKVSQPLFLETFRHPRASSHLGNVQHFDGEGIIFGGELVGEAEV